MIDLIETGGEAGDDKAEDDMPEYEATKAFIDEGVLLSRFLVI
jgi:hypothetical protein